MLMTHTDERGNRQKVKWSKMCWKGLHEIINGILRPLTRFCRVYGMNTGFSMDHKNDGFRKSYFNFLAEISLLFLAVSIVMSLCLFSKIKTTYILRAHSTFDNWINVEPQFAMGKRCILQYVLTLHISRWFWLLFSVLTGCFVLGAAWHAKHWTRCVGSRGSVVGRGRVQLPVAWL